MLSAQVKTIKTTNYKKRLSEVNRKFLPIAADIVLSAVKRYADGSRDTGRLLGSIDKRVGRDEATIGTNVFYAKFVEYGTVKMDAQPYMRTGLDDSREKLIKLYGQIFRSVFSGR